MFDPSLPTMANGTMGNMELTRAVEILNQQQTAVNAQVTDLSNRLHVAVPDMNTNIQTSADALTSMFNAIRFEIQPVIDQFTPLQKSGIAMNTKDGNQYTKLQQLEENVNARFNEQKQTPDDRTAALDASVQGLTNQMDQRAGVDTQSKVEIEVKADRLGARIDAVHMEPENAKRAEESHYHSTQMQLAAAQDRTSAAGSSGGGSREPLITHKLMMGESKLNGAEGTSAIEHWIDLMTMKVYFIYSTLR